jgi:regulator of replication initiation timing
MDLETAYRFAEFLLVVIGIGGILYRLGRMTEKFEQVGQQQAQEISELKNSVKELVKTNVRLERIEERQLSEGRRVDELTNRVNRYVNGVT